MEQLSDLGFYIMRVLWETERAMLATDIAKEQPKLVGKPIAGELNKLVEGGFVKEEAGGYLAAFPEKYYVVWLNGAYEKKS